MSAVGAHCVILGVALHVLTKRASADSVQSLLQHSAAGPLAILISFLLLDRAISTFESSCSDELPQDDGHIVAISTFCTMIVVTLCNSALSTGAMQLNVVFSLATHILIVVTYGQLHMRYGSGAVVWRTWYGGFFWPARFNMWCGTSCRAATTSLPPAGPSSPEASPPDTCL